MSLVNHLLASRTPLELAKDLAATAKENAALRQRAHQLEIELFWLRAAERPALRAADNKLQQALDVIDAASARRHERELAERAGARRCTDRED